MQNKFLPLLAILTASMLSFSTHSSEAGEGKKAEQKLSEVSELLAQHIAHLRTYQADFEQRVTNDMGREIEFSSGTFYIEKPNHFRWQIKHEFEQLIVADGEHLFTFDPDLEQVIMQNQTNVLADSPLLFLTSDAKALEAAFEISQIENLKKADSALFHLTPKKEGAIFESIHILFEKNKLIDLLMMDSLGQKTSVHFSNIQINHKIDPNLFKFEVPDGVDLVDSRE